jgi:hypothetical protein
VESPDPVDRGVMDADFASEGASRPMGLPARLRVEGLRDDAIDRRAVEARSSSGARSALLNARETKEGESSAPKTDGSPVKMKFGGDLIVGLPFGGGENDARTIYEAMRGGPASGSRQQLPGFLGCDSDIRGHPHDRGKCNPGHKGIYFSNAY